METALLKLSQWQEITCKAIHHCEDNFQRIELLKSTYNLSKNFLDEGLLFFHSINGFSLFQISTENLVHLLLEEDLSDEAFELILQSEKILRGYLVSEVNPEIQSLVRKELKLLVGGETCTSLLPERQNLRLVIH